MRELKFRVWVNDDGRYLNESERESFVLKLDGSYHIVAKFGWVEFPATIEQYTGLNDKNGKEIYEGDIIRTTIPIATNKSSTYQVFYKVDFATFEVAPIDGKIDILSGCFNFASMDNYEVIGNIHENADLLKEGK